jgi:hypothetical protein
VAKARPRRFKLPNTRGGALTLVGGLTLLGFVLGIGLVVLAPMARSGRGPFAFLRRADAPVVDARRLLAQPSLGQGKSARPELWLTPTGSFSFPSEGAFDATAGAAGAGKVTYSRAVDRRVLPVPPIKDAVGRSSLSVVVTLGQDDDARTPGPIRPDAVEITRVAIVASAPEDADPSGCVLSVGAATELRATAAFGAAAVADCQAGRLSLPSGSAVSFGVRYDLLPNYRSRDGGWREGGVLGRTEVVVAPAAAS